jgi:Mrp family chromosome partitioning ATPase
MVVTAVNLADPGHDETDAIDIADRMVVELLTDAPGPQNSGTGWANVRVRYPKTNYASRAHAIVVLIDADMTRSAVARMFNLDRSWVSRIYEREKNRE